MNSNHKSIILSLTLISAAFLLANRALAWTETVLSGGDSAMLEAPKAGFFDEMKRLPLPRSKFRAHPSGNFAAKAAEADTVELGHALRESKLSASQRAAIMEGYASQRAKLTDFRERLDRWNPKPEVHWDDGDYVTNAPEPRPTADSLDLSQLDNVPVEFVDYLQGSMAWYSQQTNDARVAWEALLNLPAAGRHYRSTWAAYMLGRSWVGEDPEKAAGYFQEVRALKSARFADRIGLAAASLGEEAGLSLRQKKFADAFALYLEQLGSGDETAARSLRFACRHALADGNDELPALAANVQIRRVMNAYLIADASSFEDSVETNRAGWLELAQAADVRDVESIEQLAVLAYQAEQWDKAQYWVQLPPQSPTAQWIEAKLLLRAGKSAQGMRLLERIVDSFPTRAEQENPPAGPGMEYNLYTSSKSVTAREHILAEIGALKLTKQNYAGALDDFLHAGFWRDAAYIAERVLKTDELKTYVDKNWPAKEEPDTNTPSFDARQNIRYLLGRRLANAGDFDTARPYFPPDQISNYNAMVAALDAVGNADSAGEQKIDALLSASEILYTYGRDLLGTEVWPDWRDGTGSDTEFIENRQETNTSIIPASEDEISRTREGIDPSLHDHYEYQAAGLAWDAANLMPDNSEEKAQTYCVTASWIKDRDPKTADHFYKALVRHCRKTAIGALADRMRWFPQLDDHGDPVPWTPAAPVETNGPPDKTGYWYALNRGNDLQDVVDAVEQQYHIETSVAAVRAANPDVNINRLKAGLLICVPLP